MSSSAILNLPGAADDTLDGAALAILSNRFDAIASKMGNTLLRTGRSGVLNRARDFSCCIVTRDAQLLVAAESLPAHVLGAELMVRHLYELHPDIKPGDAFLHNSPYHGSTHAADHSILIPVFDERGTHQFTVVAKAHQADVGNSIPTTYHGTARDVYEEGALIFPCVRVQDNDRLNEDIIRMCKMRIRVPEQWYGDFLAMMGAARIGARETQRLGAEVGWDTLYTFVEQWFDYSERMMRAAIRQLPAGEVVVQSTHDPIPGTPPEGITITSRVRVLAEEGMIEVDLRDNPDNMPCGLNQTEATARSDAMIGIYNSLNPGIPKNGGSQRCIRILLREGCIAGIPRHPYSCSVATSNIADRIANATQRGLAMLKHGVGMAECGPIIPASASVVSGIDPRTGKPHINQVFLALSAGAGSPHNDAWLTFCHVANGAMSYLDSIELAEHYQPFIVWKREIEPDTEGAGWRRGAPGIRCEFGPVQGEIECGYVIDGVKNPAKGVRGGGDAAPAIVRKRMPDGTEHELPPAAQVIVKAGEVLVSVCQPGGGYGSPVEREPERVQHDVNEGWITRKRARDVYRVAIREDGRIDAAKTAQLRAKNSAAGGARS